MGKTFRREKGDRPRSFGTRPNRTVGKNSHQRITWDEDDDPIQPGAATSIVTRDNSESKNNNY